MHECPYYIGNLKRNAPPSKQPPLLDLDQNTEPDDIAMDGIIVSEVNVFGDALDSSFDAVCTDAVDADARVSNHGMKAIRCSRSNGCRKEWRVKRCVREGRPGKRCRRGEAVGEGKEVGGGAKMALRG